MDRFGSGRGWFGTLGKERHGEPAESLSGPKNILGDSAFGIRFYLPTGVYQKTNRMAKYAILFLRFAFAAFFFSEILQKPGSSDSISARGFRHTDFLSPLLSLSEHFGFNPAYWTSTTAVILLISGYAQAILRSFRLGLTVGVVLAFFMDTSTLSCNLRTSPCSWVASACLRLGGSDVLHPQDRLVRHSLERPKPSSQDD